MRLESSTEQDIEQLTEWIKADEYHNDVLNPSWWLTGNGLLAFRLEDAKGVTMYVRLDKDEDLLRLNFQFAPPGAVSKLRVARNLLWIVPKMKVIAQQNDLKGLIFRSRSPNLVSFGQVAFGFVPVGNNDYKHSFEVG